MKKAFKFLLFLTITAAVFSGGLFAGAKYRVVDRVHIGGDGGWDYISVDSALSRLFVSHGNRVEVIDTAGNTPAGEITGTDGVHGAAFADGLNRGFTSNGKADTVSIFDLKTLKKIGEVKTGENPDAILYDEFSKKVFTFNGKSKDATVIGAATGKVLGTIPFGGKPEFACSDGKGMVYVNIEDKSEVAEIDAVKAAVTRRFSIKPGEEPTGIAIDAEDGYIFSGCRNKMMTVVDIKTGKLISTVPVGAGVDGCGFDPEKKLAFTANGQDGTMSVIKETSKGKFEVIQTVETKNGARTMVVDEATHKIYLPTADFGPAPEKKKGEKWARPNVIKGSFVVLVVGEK